MKIAAVTPWYQMPELAADYERVVDGFDLVVVVDNHSPEPVEVAGAVVLAQRSNRGFSKASNVGYREALDAGCDAILFLNNDVRAAGGRLEDAFRAALTPACLVGATFGGPHSRGRDGQPRRYLEGWCLGALTATWEQLSTGPGPWCEEFTEPAYYGDNDLCARAVAAGIELRQAQMPVVHLGNYTSRHISAYRDQVAATNRERYLDRLEALGV